MIILVTQIFLILLVCLLVYLSSYYSKFEAKSDSALMRRNILIDHAEGLKDRVGTLGMVMLVVLLGMGLADFFLPIPLLKTITWMCVMVWGMWTCMFRQELNKENGNPWYYMDDLDLGGNRYDEFWWILRLFIKNRSFRRITQDEWNALVKDGTAKSYEKQVALMAYIFETLVAAFALLQLIRIIADPHN